MSSQSHPLTTETEPDAEKHANIVYHLRVIGNILRTSGKFIMPSTYLIFVIFFTQAKFLENKTYTEKRVITQ